MTTSQILQVVATCQGTFVLGISIFVIVHYMIAENEKRIRLQASMFIFSYDILTVCTILTVYDHTWPWYSLWQILIMIGWLIGDVSLVIIHRRLHRHRLTTLRKVP